MTGEIKLDAAQVYGALTDLRQRRPRVHCLTNFVAQTYTANMLLAAGAQPSMTVSMDEIADFTLRADALLVNLGTLDADRRAAMRLAISVARDEQIPWILDPVLVNASGPRLEFAQELMEMEPLLIRANADELAALAGDGDKLLSADRLALEFVTTFAITGETDKVTDGVQSVFVNNGDLLMTKVTAVGCAITAVMAGFACGGTNSVEAAAAALACAGIAGEVAAERAHGPGSFSTALIDALYTLDERTISQKLDVT